MSHFTGKKTTDQEVKGLVQGHVILRPAPNPGLASWRTPVLSDNRELRQGTKAEGCSPPLYIPSLVHLAGERILGRVGVRELSLSCPCPCPLRSSHCTFISQASKMWLKCHVSPQRKGTLIHGWHRCQAAAHQTERE